MAIIVQLRVQLFLLVLGTDDKPVFSLSSNLHAKKNINAFVSVEHARLSNLFDAFNQNSLTVFLGLAVVVAPFGPHHAASSTDVDLK